MKLLSGSELAGYIKKRQAVDVSKLRSSRHIQPKLAIVVTIDHPVINVYMKLKKRYGQDIGVDVDIYRIEQSEAPAKLKDLNQDQSVHGIIVQLPIEDPSKTEELVKQVSPLKDVDALSSESVFEPATPMAIMWLMAGYNIDLNGKQVLLIGHGKLVGQPLEQMLASSGINVRVADRFTKDLTKETLDADVIITATGNPAILYPDMVKQGAIVIDAGVASEDGKTVGDVDPSLYERDDLTITPQKGGVGPLTVCALFENVIRAARESQKPK